jgi:hypothetical protein
MKTHEFRVLEAKLKLTTRNSGDRLAWFEHGGKIITRTKRSHGRGFDLPRNLIRQQLKLSEEELSGILKCFLYHQDYVDILKRKGLIPNP